MIRLPSFSSSRTMGLISHQCSLRTNLELACVLRKSRAGFHSLVLVPNEPPLAFGAGVSASKVLPRTRDATTAAINLFRSM